MRYPIAPSLLIAAIAVAPSALFAADPEYSVFVLPADTGKAAFINGVGDGGLSADGRNAIISTEDNNGNAKSYRWTFGGTSTQALTLAGYADIEFGAIANNGVTIGTVAVNDQGYGFPGSASGATVTKRGAVTGDFADMNDAGTVIVGGLFTNTTSTSTVYSTVRAKKWTSVSGAPADVLAGTTYATAPSFADEVSPNGSWIAGFLLNPGDLTANAFLENTGAAGDPVVVTAPFLAPDAWGSAAIANDGKAVLGWGDDEDIGFGMAYFWNGAALSEVVPSDETFFTKDWMANADVELPLLGVWGRFKEISGKGLTGVVEVHLDAASAPNPDNIQEYLKFRWLASNSSLIEFKRLMPTIGIARNYYPYTIDQQPIEVWNISDLTSKGQILASIKFPNSSTVAAAILTPVPVVSVTSTALSKGEAGGTFTATVTRSAGPAGPVCANWPLTVKLSYLGKAVRGTDFTAPLTVTIPAGQTAATVTMNIVNDSEVELAEAFTLRVSNPSAGSYTPQTLYRLSATQNKLSFMITDNDSAVASSDR